MEKSKTVERILKTLEIHEVNIDGIDLNADGVVIEKSYTVDGILEDIRSVDEYSEIRGTVSMSKAFNAHYSAKYLSYERLNHTCYFNDAMIAYGCEDVECVKLFVSDYNWIDIHVHYKNEGFASIVVVPKSKSQIESESTIVD